MRVIVVLFSMFAFDVAFANTSVVMPSSIEPGMETSVVLALPEMASNKTQRLTFSVEAPNVATNQLEIWFCNDTFGSRESRGYMIGLDEGRLITGRDTVESVEVTGSLLPVQNIFFTTSVRSRTNSFRTKVDFFINGAAYSVDSQSPHLWRSIRVVSRGLDYPQPRLSESLVTIVFSVRVR